MLISPIAGQVGVLRADPLVKKVARTHKPVTGVPASDDRNAYITPMHLLGRDVLFAEYRDAEALRAGVASFRDSLGLFVLLSLLIALPLFYVLGGRSVGVLYRAALQRARRDGLTDLDNHRAFQDELTARSARRRATPARVTLALLDIDDFKFENDRHGHQHGDRLLCELAELLREQRAGDRAFRLGGDEFAVLLAHTSEADADVPLERIRTAVEQRLSGVTTSIGFSAARADDREPSSLWGRADAALLEAKRRGGNSIVASTEVADSVPVVTIEKVRAVRSLIDAGAVDVAFQPIWHLAGTHVLGYEALARPRSSDLSGPGEAFEIADSIGRGHELDAVCRRATLRAAAELPKDALLFLNVSPQTLEHDGLAGDSLVLAVRGAGYEPEQVVLEITERTDARKELLIPEAARLRSLGFNLALDDVGAGNAGLEMLRALPVDFIKIDRAVVANAVADRSARAVMLAIMAFARESSSFVIAEGIETEAMLELARDPEPEGEVRPAGAHGAQGFLLGRPAPVPSESPRYDATLQTLTELTADRERRRIAAALQRGDELYRVMLRTVPDLIVALFDRDLCCQVIDGGMGSIDMWREILEGKTVLEALGGDADAERLDALLRPVLEGELTDFEFVGRRSGMHLSVQAVPVRDDRAGVIGVMAVCRDVTPRHEVDAALRSCAASRPAHPPARASRPRHSSARSGYCAGHGRCRDAPPVRLDGGGHDPQVAEVRRGRGQAREELVEIETDKANMTYEADSDGTLTIVAKEGDTLPVGETIARLGDGSESGGDDEDARGGARRGDAGGARGRGAAATKSPKPRRRTAPATASARRRRAGARAGRGSLRQWRWRPRQGVAGRQADGARNGRRDRPDRGLRARWPDREGRRRGRRPGRRRDRRGGGAPEGRAEAGRGGARRRGEEEAPKKDVPAPIVSGDKQAGRGEATQQDLTRLQQTVARRMAESKATAPDFVLTVEVDMEEAVALRKQLKVAAGDLPAPSFNDFVIKASALALRDFPRANGAYRDGNSSSTAGSTSALPSRARTRSSSRPCSTPTPSRSATSPRESRALAERVAPAPSPAGALERTFTVSNLGIYGSSASSP